VIVGYCAATIAAKARYLRRTAPWL
jgi:hypothetical protein